MGPGYESAPRPIGPSSRRRATLAAAAALAFIGLVVVKPWGITSTDARPADRDVAPSVMAGLRLAPSALPVPTDMPAWPVAVSRSQPSAGTTSGAEELVDRLDARSTGWGLADGGSGPRLAYDGSWVDWQPVPVAPATEGPGSIVVWPGTGLCTDLPVLRGGPSFIAVSAPPHLSPTWQLTGWWSDGTRVASLVGSVRRIPTPGSPRLVILERLDGSPWPAGRYEFHVSVGDRTLAMTACLGG